ncbi:hypothetical protein GcM3_076008 [Golovinomyces cichoracearum]|uniref:Uncharacterized protein n=1 Tax=Golovinomyces cichoracearum TaxID=62708 RepID=A0A420IQR0_9PEZI|nr:hypothetical protein GcM3_076008 [Golovinomyces cichoracearum]
MHCQHIAKRRRPYEIRCPVRTKTTAAAINAKAKAAMKAKLSNTNTNTSPTLKPPANVSPNARSPGKNVSQTTPTKYPAHLPASVTGKSQIPSSSRDPRVPNGVQKSTVKNENQNSHGKSQKYAQQKDSPVILQAKVAASSQIRPKTITPGIERVNPNPGTNGTGQVNSKKKKQSTGQVNSKAESHGTEQINSKKTKHGTGHGNIKKATQGIGPRTATSTNHLNSTQEKSPHSMSQKPTPKLDDQSFKPAVNSATYISRNFGAAPNIHKPKSLPANYNATKRKVTMTIVALPIALVTSWVLFERLVLGKERKELVPPGVSRVKEDNE